MAYSRRHPCKKETGGVRNTRNSQAVTQDEEPKLLFIRIIGSGEGWGGIYCERPPISKIQ